jgi:hypothetical protein
MTDAQRPHTGPNDEHPPSGGDPYTEYDDFNLPSYQGAATFQKLPLVTDGAAPW